MLVRRPNTRTLSRWDGRDLEALAAQRLLHTDAGYHLGAVIWRVAGIWPTATMPTTYADLIPGFLLPRVMPSGTPAQIQVERLDPADTGTLTVEYLDVDWYHRSAVYVLSGATTTLAEGLGTGDAPGQPVLAWRILSALYLGTARNVGQIDVKLGITNVHARILPTHRASSGLVWTVPRGQRLSVSSYQVSVDTNKSVSVRIDGSLITDLSTGAYVEAVRNESAEVAAQVADTYRPEVVVASNPVNGQATFAPIDIAYLFRTTAPSTTGSVDGIARGTVQLDEGSPDPEPDKIPWVRANRLRLTAQGQWPLGPTT